MHDDVEEAATSRSMRRAICSPKAVPSPAPPCASETVMQCRVLTAYAMGAKGLPLSSRLLDRRYSFIVGSSGS